MRLEISPNAVIGQYLIFSNAFSKVCYHMDWRWEVIFFFLIYLLWVKHWKLNLFYQRRYWQDCNVKTTSLKHFLSLNLSANRHCQGMKTFYLKLHWQETIKLSLTFSLNWDTDIVRIVNLFNTRSLFLSQGQIQQ